MREKNIWNATRSLLVVFNYEDDEQLNGFRKSLDKMLNMSNVDRLIIVVNIAKEVDKNTLPPHFLIYYNSPADFSFFGKLKDVQLETELQKAYDLLIWNAELDSKIFPLLQQTSIQRRVLVNAQNAKFDLQIDTAQSDPQSQLQYIQQTLERIAQ